MSVQVYYFSIRFIFFLCIYLLVFGISGCRTDQKKHIQIELILETEVLGDFDEELIAIVQIINVSPNIIDIPNQQIDRKQELVVLAARSTESLDKSLDDFLTGNSFWQLPMGTPHVIDEFILGMGQQISLDISGTPFVSHITEFDGQESGKWYVAVGLKIFVQKQGKDNDQRLYLRSKPHVVIILHDR